MTYKASLKGNMIWVCDMCGATTETAQESHAVNMRRRDLSFNVSMPKGWVKFTDEYGTGDACPRCFK